MTNGPRRIWLAIVVVFTLVVATVVVWAYALGTPMPLPGFGLSVEAVEQEILSWGAWGIAAAILLMVTALAGLAWACSRVCCGPALRPMPPGCSGRRAPGRRSAESSRGPVHSS